jgi:acetyl esterase/lipase
MTMTFFGCENDNNNEKPVDPPGGNGFVPPDTPDDDLHYKSISNLSYGSDSKQTLEIRYPTYLDLLSNKVFIALFLGDTQSDNSHFDILIEELLDKSHLKFAAVIINYRTTNKTTEMLDDIYAAIDFLKTNATKYKFETTKLGIMGYSVGGYLSILYAYKEIASPIPVKFVLAQSAFTSISDPAFYSFDTTDNEKKDQLLTDRLALVSQLVGKPISLDDYNTYIAAGTGNLFEDLQDISVDSYYNLAYDTVIHLYHGIRDELYNIKIMQDFAANKSKVTLFTFNAEHDNLNDDETTMDVAIKKLQDIAESIFIKN